MIANMPFWSLPKNYAAFTFFTYILRDGGRFGVEIFNGVSSFFSINIIGN
jgi:hypothetical protein